MLPQPPTSVKPTGLTDRTVIGFDCETHLITQGRNCPRLICVTLSGRGAPHPAVLRQLARHPIDVIVRTTQNGARWSCLLGRNPGRECIRELLQDAAVTLVAHSAVFDGSVVAEADPRNEILRLVFEALKDNPTGAQLKCTRIREQLLSNALGNFNFDARINKKSPGYTLADCVQIYFGVDLQDVKKNPDSWRLRYHMLDGLPVTKWPAPAVDYAIEDAIWAEDVAWAQGRFTQADNGHIITHADGSVVDENYQLRADWALRLMSCWGPRTDEPKVEAWRVELQGAVDHADAMAEAAGFVKGGKRNMAALREIIDTAYGGRAPQTATGKTSTARDVLLASGHAALIAYAEAGVQRKNLTTYLPILLKGVHHPLTSRPNCLVRSGRTSWKNPSLQTGPRKGDYRKSFLARPGMVYVACDYDRIELAALGQIHYWMFGTSAIRDAFIAGEDLHLSLAAEMLNMSYTQALAIYNDPTHVLYATMEETRQGAKIANFGFPGGLVARTFVEYAAGFGINISLDRAEEIRTAWFARWPEMVPYFEHLQKLAQWGEFTYPQWVSGRQRSECGYTVAANTGFQGLTADGAKDAMFWVAFECYCVVDSPLYGVRPWVFIHDEIIAEGPEDTVHLWARRLEEIMVACMQRVIPDVPVSAEAAAMRRWYKGAKAKHDAQGRLIPWAPQ